MDEGPADNYFRIWTCGFTNEGDGHGRDVVNFSKVRKDPDQIVPDFYKGVAIKPTGIYSGDKRSWDSLHTCAPSVVKHDNVQLRNTFYSSTGISATELYLMYYECAPQYYDQGGQPFIHGLTHICLAASANGETWYKYSNASGTARFRAQDTDAIVNYPTPVIRSQDGINKCGVQLPTAPLWRHTINTSLCAQPDLSEYGAGHPSAMRMQNGGVSFIRVFYVDPAHDQVWCETHSCPPNSLRLYRVADSFDGITFQNTYDFEIAGIERSDLGSGPSFQYAHDPVDNVYVATTALAEIDADRNLFVSSDLVQCSVCFPVNWHAPQILGNGVDSSRTSGQAAFVTNKWGQIDLPAVTIFSSEFPPILHLSGNHWRDQMIYRITGELEP